MHNNLTKYLNLLLEVITDQCRALIFFLKKTEKLTVGIEPEAGFFFH